MTEKKMTKNQNFFVSLLIVVVLALLMVMPAGVIKAWPMHDNFVNQCMEFNPDTMGNITLEKISAPPYYRVAFTDKDNQLKLDMANNGQFPAVVQVDIYSVEPDGVTQTFLKTVNLGAIPGGHEKTRNAFLPWEDMWQPSERGRNWIHGEIFVRWFHNERINVGNFTESFNVVPGDRTLLVLGPTTINEPTVWDNLTVIVNGDIVVNAPLAIMNTDVIGNNLLITASTDISASSSIDIASAYDGQYRVEVYPAGILNLYGKIWNNPQSAHYWFYMNGTLNVTKDPNRTFAAPGVIENTYGPDDLSQPGGVICTNANGAVSITDGGSIRNSSSHGLYLYNTTAVLEDANIYDNNGYGVYSVNCAPTIKNSHIYNNRYNIYAINWINAWGKPAYTRGMETGYFIWYDPALDWWFVQMNSNGLHQFTGTINYRTTSGWKTEPINETVNSTETGKTKVSDLLEFDLYIDGQSALPDIYVGEKRVTPASNPFQLSVNRGNLSDNEITGNPNVDVDVKAGAVWIASSSVDIYNNTITENHDGIELYSSNVSIILNTISGNRKGNPPGNPPIDTGIDAYSSYVRIEGNEMEDNKGGIFLSDCRGTITNNSIAEEPLVDWDAGA